MIRLALALLAAASQASFAAEVTAEVKPETIIFRDGKEMIAEYKYGGTVAVEKGEGTKPLAKPYFFPLNAPGGTPTTRGWPMIRGTSGETTDHFHQKSAWFCHGDVIAEGLELKTKAKDKGVKGVDFWAEFPGHGRIVCTKANLEGSKIITENEWYSPDEVLMLNEKRILNVKAIEAGYLITLEITLTANNYPIIFGDTKEGSLGVRVNDSFRLNGPDSAGVVTSSDGLTAKAPAKDNLPMWGQIAAWNDYSGTVDGKLVGIAIFADPKNAQPSAWHTRAYGLMAANPFGRDKSGFPALKGKTDLVKLVRGESLNLRFGIYTHTGDAKTGKVKEAYEAFRKVH